MKKKRKPYKKRINEEDIKAEEKAQKYMVQGHRRGSFDNGNDPRIDF